MDAEVRANGHEERSEKTRARLIEVAIAVIGASGYEGATTRALTRAAGANLSAIPYHFGTKKALHLAAAEAAAERARAAFLAALAPEDGGLEERLVRLHRLVVGTEAGCGWMDFLGRAAHENDEAFAILYERAIAPTIARLAEGAGSPTGPGGEELRMRLHALLTSILATRFIGGVMLRGLGRTAIEGEAAARIEAMIRDLCRSGFLAVDGPSGEPA